MKRGEESGYIKISLRGDTEEEQITIMRKIDTRNKSEWLFNGKIFDLYTYVHVEKFMSSDLTHDIDSCVKIISLFVRNIYKMFTWTFFN